MLNIKKKFFFVAYYIFYCAKVVIENSSIIIRGRARKDLTLFPLKIYDLITRYSIIKKDIGNASDIADYNARHVKLAFEWLKLDYFDIPTDCERPYVQRVGINFADVDKLIAALKKLSNESPEFKIIFEPFLVRIPLKIKDIPKFLLKPIILRSKRLAVFAELGGFFKGLFPATFSCEIDFWYDSSGLFRSYSPNDITSCFPSGISYKEINEVFATNESIHHIDFPVDFVYTWVDSRDEGWLKQKQIYQSKETFLHNTAISQARFYSRDELKYSLRSICYFANFFNHVYIVTNRQVPDWLNVGSPKISVIKHEQIFKDLNNLPTFNSHAIESCLHRIPGLSEHFIYMNDDFFIGRPLVKANFFTVAGYAKSFFDKMRPIAYIEVSKSDRPFISSAKKNRQLIKNKFNKLSTYEMIHGPYCHVKTNLKELERDFVDEFKITENKRFRTCEDIAIPSSLAHHYGLIKGYNIEAGHEYSIIRIEHIDFLVRALVKLLVEKDKDFFCLNEIDVLEEHVEERDKIVHWFLEKYFPYKSEFEL